MKDEMLHKIKSSIQENKSHLQKIKRAKDLLKDLFPANVNSFQAFSPQEIGHIDQFIYRFTKMQDSFETLNLLYEEIEKFLLIFQQLKQAWEKS